MFNYCTRCTFAFFVLLLVSCGGGGGGGGSSSPAPTPSPQTSISFTASAVAGELVSYTLNTSALTYSYTILESQYGLTGRSGSGALVANGDGTYSLSGIPNSRAVLLQNGMLIAAIRETFNGITKTVPVIGFSNPLTTVSGIAATYNYVSYQCPTTNCSAIAAMTSYGTFRINPDATWTSCPNANIDTNPIACVAGTTGIINSLGGGKWQVVNSLGGAAGTAIAYRAANGQNVVLIDLKDPLVLGYGAVVGSSVAAITAADVNGTWKEVVYGKASGTTLYGSLTLTVTGGNTDTTSNIVLNGTSVAGTTKTFTLNSPWNGWVSSGSGAPALMAGTGMFAESESQTISGVPTDFFGIGFKM